MTKTGHYFKLPKARWYDNGDGSICKHELLIVLDPTKPLSGLNVEGSLPMLNKAAARAHCKSIGAKPWNF